MKIYLPQKCGIVFLVPPAHRVANMSILSYCLPLSWNWNYSLWPFSFVSQKFMYRDSSNIIKLFFQTLMEFRQWWNWSHLLSPVEEKVEDLVTKVQVLVVCKDLQPYISAEPSDIITVLFQMAGRGTYRISGYMLGRFSYHSILMTYSDTVSLICKKKIVLWLLVISDLVKVALKKLSYCLISNCLGSNPSLKK